MNVAPTALVLGIFLLLPNLHAEAPAFPKCHPTPISDGPPVLVFEQPKLKSGELALCLFDPKTHESPQTLWQDRYHPNPNPLKRFSDRVILIEFPNKLSLVDLPTGVVTPLLAGKEQNELVANLEQVLQITADGFLVITADEPQKVAMIHRDGSLTAI